MSRPHCDATGFGWIEIDGERYEHDVLIHLGGRIKKRKKKLSKRIYGTSHTLSLDEAKHIFEKGARTLIIAGARPFGAAGGRGGQQDGHDDTVDGSHGPATTIVDRTSSTAWP